MSTDRILNQKFLADISFPQWKLNYVLRIYPEPCCDLPYL